MTTNSGQLSYKGSPISVKTMAKDVMVEDTNSLFTATDLESVLAEVFTNNDISNNDISNKIDKISGMGLSEANFTYDEKNKLASVEEDANYYVHPITHDATIIKEDTTHRFVTDDQIMKWETSSGASDLQGLLDSATSYTDTNINAIKGGVSTNLNSLYKIALAINNDASYDAHIKTYINSKLSNLSSTDSIDIESIDELDSFDIKVGDVINIVTYTNDFYKCIDMNATTFDTKFQTASAQSLTTSILVTTKEDAIDLTLNMNDYIYIPRLATIEKSYECITDDSSITDFNSKFKILLQEGYIEQKLTELIDGAPGTLNTLNELSQALNDDANFGTTVTNQLTALNTSITNVSNTVSALTTSTTANFSNVNATLTTMHNQIVSLQNADTAALDGGTF